MANVYSAGTGPRIALSDVLSTVADKGPSLVASNTTFTAGTVSISGFGAATINTAAGIIRVSVPTQTVQPTLGVVASDATFTSGTVSISGFGAATVNTAASIIRISVPVQTAQTFVGGIAVNAATTYTSGTVVLSAGANITLGTNAQTVTISGVAAQTVQTQNMVAVVASNATFSSGSVSISGANGITVGTAAGRIDVSGPGLQSYLFINSYGIGQGGSAGQTNASASILSFHVPEAISFSRADVLVNLTLATVANNSTAAAAFSNAGVIYSRNGSTLNPIVGALNTVTLSWVSNTGIYASASANRYVSFGLATSLSAGQYWLGVHISSTSAISTGTATTALNATMSMYLGSIANNLVQTAFGDLNAVAATTLVPAFLFHGLISSAITATSQTLQGSQITATGGGALSRPNLLVLLRNVP